MKIELPADTAAMDSRHFAEAVPAVKTSPAGRSRRSLLRAAVGAAAALCAGATAAPAQIKISQSAVGYQDRPNGNSHCANCAHFVAPANCKLIMGPISPQGWCRLYAPASGQAASAAPAQRVAIPS
jgi:hypothetical protein